MTITASSISERRHRRTYDTQLTARFDSDVVEQFKELAKDGSYQALMNHALRQWLEAQSVTQMVREELRSELDDLKKALASEHTKAG